MTTNSIVSQLIVDKSKCESIGTHLPSFDRNQLKHGIVHLSVGNFHRSHLAYYMDVLASEHQQTEWGIVGIGVRSFDKPMSIVMNEQNGLYTLVTKGTDENDVNVRIIGSLINYIYAPDEPESALAVLVHPDTKIVSMTITESGYDLDMNNVDIQHDISNSDKLRTVFGFIVHALDARRRANRKPFTVMSCDNVQQNGEVTKKCILQFAKSLNNTELIEYIETQVTFPNAMVDRITPATTDADREYVRSHCGIADGWPVTTEPFIQWVIEDSFCNGRPPLELLSTTPYNVLLTEHVEAYECMKMRLLNASHTSMCYIGHLMGYSYIHEIMLDKQIEIYIEQLMNIEITPTLPPVPGIDLDNYKRTLIERFSNPHIKDTALRVCMDGASKFPKFLVPTIVEQLKRGISPHFCALSVAAWIRYLSGFDEENKPIILQDALATELKLSELATQIKPGAKQILNINQIFGVLAEYQHFTEAVERVVHLLYEIGSKKTLQQWINEAPTKK
ncbi:unnamed protein product [Rotaria magnacalcarata]|uniref:mannitol 2-dehydrogenase n=1 Tax=Rotaria magnacalcarata TaxID=392030 RepID=A0A816XQ24_9BILA|nr:unnamed protein product [Rotaria magnacalcarata]CAF2149622.1 unnamed protein product [Rotaria magnacalcarata]CAF4860538.1 unnamed protein product [Rotaria magnacalcarata]CAF4864209.1 unnamed protein product [Rotaria magnacalcarata]